MHDHQTSIKCMRLTMRMCGMDRRGKVTKCTYAHILKEARFAISVLDSVPVPS